MSTRPITILSFLGLLLAVAIGIQVYQSQQAGAGPDRPPLRGELPTELPGWTSRELPLAETEELKNAVSGILQFDDYFSRAYSTGGIEVTLYVAYWSPGKIPPRMVGRHTPDRCWILNGWECTERTRAVGFTGTSGPLKPAELGTYTFRDRARLHVAFWHLVGDDVYAYGPEQSRMIAFAPLQDLLTFGLNQRREQFFIRLASTVPLEKLWQNTGFRQLISSLETLGLAVALGPGHHE